MNTPLADLFGDPGSKLRAEIEERLKREHDERLSSLLGRDPKRWAEALKYSREQARGAGKSKLIETERAADGTYIPSFPA